MTEDEPQVPDQARELAIFEPLSTLLWEALEAGTSQATSFFASNTGRFSPSLFAHLVRWFGGSFLQDKGLFLEEFEPEEMLSDGLCFVFHSRRYRVWKSKNGELPPPGPSQAKRDFYNQRSAQPRLFVLDGEVSVELNLGALWSVGSSHRLSSLRLVCPRWASFDGLRAAEWWNVELPHPATLVAPVSPDSASPQADLPIELQSQGDEMEQAE